MERPTLIQGELSCILLVLASIVCLPLSLFVTVFAHLIYRHDRITLKHRKKTALINGGRMQKSIFVSRALAKKGYRVIMVEEKGWGECCAARFSSSVNFFYLVPAGGGQLYINALVRLLRKEAVDLFVPCSGAGTTLEDAKVAQIIRREMKGKVQTLIQDPDLVEALHEKDQFVQLILDLGLDAPASHTLRTPQEALDLLRQPGQPPMILKAANVLDDIGRGDLTNFPLLNEEKQPDWKRTTDRLKYGLHIPMTPKTPYIAQEFVGGEGASEWCTHATVIDGRVTAFVCCPSNDMLMTYHDATHTFIGRRALKWTNTFLSRLSKSNRWKDTRLTGQFSMDFIHQPSSDRLVVIECNPRVHTAIGLLSGSSYGKECLGEALEGGNSATLMPSIGTSAMSWWGHDLITRRIPNCQIVSNRLLEAIHPLWVKEVPNASHPLFDLDVVGRDAAWDRHDPFVFFALYQVQMPFLLIRQLLVRRRAYSRINISTARIFEC